jgi:RHS repeat-associated protein
VTLTVNKATPVITWATPAAITYGTALSATQLDATANVAGTFAYSPAAGTVLAAGSQTLNVTFTPTDSADYTTATASVTLTVNKATPVITWATPGSITYGTALSATQLDATANVAGTFAYSPAAGTVLTAGSQTLNVTFTPTDSTDYTTATASVTLTVNKATPGITWANPASITYGRALSATQLDATANVAGTFAYSPAAGTVLTAGSQTLNVTFTPTDSTDYTTATASVTLTVNKATPVITWATPAAITYGTALSATQLDATANVAGTFAYSPAAGAVLTAGSPTLNVTFTPTDSTDYTTATASVTLAVNTATTQITWATPAAITYGTALSATQLDATANVAGTFAYSPAASVVLTAGSQTLNVTFTPTDSTDYTTATASVTLTVNQATPVITWATPAPITYGTALSATQLDATANVPGTFAYSPASGTVPAAGSQTLNVTFTPTDTTDYVTATASVVLAVNGNTHCNPANGYSYQREITIPHGNVPNTDQINFPFLFNTTDPTLAGTANNGHVQNPNGYDIIFTSDAAGQNPLNYEMEEYNSATGQVIAWVQIPDLSHTSDTTIYMFYGNSSITTSQQNPTAVWDANYKAVWHVPNGTQLSLADSTSNGNNGTDNGATAAAGQIDGGMSTNGSTYATIGTPADLANLAQGNATFSAWVYSAANGGVIMAKDDDNISSGWTLGLTNSNMVDFSVIFNSSNFELSSQQPIPTGQWSYVVVTLAGTATQSQATVYVNGVPSNSGSGGSQQTTNDSADILYLANARFGDQAYQPLNGLSDEFRISNSIRSADWIATEYANQSSPSTFYNLSPEDVTISPTSATLYGSQTQQFTATLLNGCGSSVTWSINPAGMGTISASGLYTAPATIATPETVTVTATSQAASASATVNLLPPVAVTVSPASVTLSDGSQQQQFTASVANAANSAVTWSISPSGTGTIDATGIYTAPATIPAQQTVTVTAISQADPTKSASATITLTPPNLPPPVCATNGYGYERAIVIDHSQVPNTDQANFPFLLNSTDPAFATTANGGHMTNFNANDLIFTSDPAGQNVLNYELEEYNPVTGQVIAWIKIPNLSHTADTTLYMFYGNPTIASPQQNPSGVWDANYMGVWHVPNGTQLSLADSTSNGDNGTDNGATATSGQIDGGMLANGNTYATIGTQANLANLSQGSATISAWVNPSSDNGGWIIGKDGMDANAGWALGVDGGNAVWFMFPGGNQVFLWSNGQVPAGTWSYVTVTLDQNAAPNGLGTLYINGQPNITQAGYIGQSGDDSAEAAYLGNAACYWICNSLTGSADEFRISNTARSGDWITTEYNNQNSPSTFYTLSPEGVALSPRSVTLYGSQTQQFTAAALNSCSNAVSWSLNPAGVGAISASGLYTAPATIATPQTVILTATSQSNPAASASATINLLPPVAVNVTPASVTISDGGQQQQFAATVVNTSNTAVTWSVSPSGAGTIDQTGLYTAPESIASQQTVTITATSQFDSTASGSATITLTPPSLPPPICASNGYSFMRAVVINHNLVPNTDQANFPFLFNSTDPAFATAGNGGHMANENAYDLIFTSDPAGQNPLNYELEEYNPVTGQIIAWVGIPNLSHSTDTIIYVFYGNPNIATSQQNAAAVWDANFMGVWHVPNGTQLSLADSTSNGNSATNEGATATAGEIDGGMATTEYAYATIGSPSNLADLAHGSATFSAWVNPSTIGGIILGKGGFGEGGWTLGLSNQNQLQLQVYDAAGDPFYDTPVSAGSIGSGWNYVTATISQSSTNPIESQIALYVNGAPSGTGTITINNLIDDTSVPAYLAFNDEANYFPFSSGVYGAIVGAEDEFRISNIARSADWIATEYMNQGFPSSFYGLYAENFVGSIPSTETLYASQSEQFSTVAACNAPLANWSMPSGSPGTLTAGGLYTAPSSIATQQTVSITATSQVDGSTIGTSVVTLDPPVSVSVSPAAPTLYVPGETVQFTATVSNAIFNQVTWSVSGNPCCYTGTITGTGLYTAPFFDAPQTITITATSVQDPTQSASATLSLTPVIITPSGTSVYGGFTQQFTANVPVVWSLAQGGIGTIDQTGLYSAPVNPTNNGTSFSVFATAQADPNASATAWVDPLQPLILPVTPAAVSLYGGQSEAYNVCMATSASNFSCQDYGDTVANWSISPASAGTISSSGVYTAPALVPTQQTLTVTATDVALPSVSSTGTITLIPPVVNVAPQSVTMYAEQKQQFNAVVTNSSTTAVTWSISPATGAGSISSTGLYSAPPSIASQQTVTVTATLQAIPSITASAVITLSPAQCPSTVYSYVRPIVIDHTKVPSSDQPNFPFYFAVTDPLLASTGNGGHVTSPTGNDIVFSSDPAGLQALPFDLEQYNPATGQIVAWLQVPVLSHSQDTVIYMFYGNSTITLPQQNPSAVWDTNYTAVYQFEDLQNGNWLDSTINENNATTYDLQQAPGQPGGAGVFDGATTYAALPTNDFASYPYSGASGAIFNASFGVWFKTASSGVILGQTGAVSPGGDPGGWVPALYIDTNGYLEANFLNLQNAQQIVSPTVLNDNNWHYAMLTFDTNATNNTIGFLGGVTSTTSGIETLYVDGKTISSQSGVIPDGFNSAYSYFLGTGYAQGWASTPGNDPWFYFNGSLDEVEISSIARSNGWVQAEYYNQSSPSTFFSLGAEVGATPSLNPLAVTLYESQSQQFTVLQTNVCNAGDAVWSMPAGSPGTLSPTGLYTAPAAISTQQTVSITGATLGVNSTQLNATITLMPPVSITVTPGIASLPAGGTQQFTATVANSTNTAVTWTIAPTNAGSISPTGLYTAPSTLNGQQTVSVIATSLADPTQSASAAVTLGVAASPVSVVIINPPSATLYSGGVQQFTATVTNMSNAALTWSISPAGVGTVDDTGFYTAPATIAVQQAVTITATSVANPALSASATINLAPTTCMANGYSYTRQIVIDHTKIPNTDQANFPFLFSTTDPLLATTANGGHVTNPNGYDIIFSTDPNGLSTLNYEVEEYNPATGQIVAWVQIPDLSHASDTVIYLFYGNPSVTTSQQNPNAVWDSTYQAVWHLPNGTTLSANDSTTNANNGAISDATATAGQIDGGASFNGSTSQIICGSNVPGFQFSASQSFTDSAWFNLSTSSNGWMSILSNSRDVSPWHGLWIDGTTAVFGESGNMNGPAISINAWHYMVAVQNGGAGRSLYVDGVLVASDQNPQDANGSGTCYIGNDSVGEAFQGSIDEVRIASVARSSDWVAAEYANESSPSTFFALSSENTTGIAPTAVTLYANQSQQFAAPGLCSAGVSWSLSADAEGTLTSSGLYTSPGSISEPQTLTVTATSLANPGQSASATVTLMAPISVTVSPASITLSQNQTRQFTANVINSSNPAVIWTMSPTGLGSLDQMGAYIAPSSITTQQTVTITATSVTDPTKSASAMVTLAPSTCASTGYGYQRVVVIDHTKVANTDQINYPFLFNSTDPDLATVDNGGHVANPNGDDIIFSTDPNGQTRLDFEVEQYNPATGQLVAWMRIPSLSHSTDTIIYVFYGNPAINASQANPAGVWDSNYQAVYHLGNLPATEIASDSTNYQNSATFTSLTAIPGEIDGAGALDGVTSFLEIPATAFPSYPTGVYSNIGVNTTWDNNSFDATFGIWFKTAGFGGLLDQTAGDSCLTIFGFCIFTAPELPGTNPYGSWGNLLDINFDGYLEGRGVGPSTQVYNDNNWHYATITFGNGVNELYADGQLVATGGGGTFGFSGNYAYFVGTEDIESDTSGLDSQPWKYLPGEIDEINVSSIARSGGWIQTQYNNQSSPSTFYTFYSPNAIQVAPSSINLYASQSEQFTVPGTCDSTIAWSIPAGALGTLSSTGLYTAPSVISSQQTVAVSAMSQSNGSSFGSAQVTLLPAPQPLSLVASSPSPYQVGSSQSFTATLLDPQGNPRIGGTVNFTVAGPNETVGSATTNASGAASFAYTGSNNGTDTVQATASVEGSLLTSNSLTAAWLTPPPAQAPTLTLLPEPSPGRGALMGAFTDNNGNLLEPIVVGTAARTFITPAGATRLQLGINDNYYLNNGGAGFVVAVNGSNIAVPPTARPWNWQTGGLNNSYQYGINDGTSPVIAAANLTAGQPVTLAYQSGTISTNYPISNVIGANGDSNFITGTQIWQGAYFPTLYTTGTAYPQTQPINVFAVATDATGAPVPNSTVTLTISGANPGQIQATTDATGTASFLYTGQNAGNDSLQAQETLAGQGTLESNLTTIDWTNYPTPPPVGSLSLNEIVTVVNSQSFSSFARNASGNALPNVNVGFYVTGVDNFQSSSNTNNIGQASFDYYHTQSGNYSVIAVDSVDRNVIVTGAYSAGWTVPSAPPVSSVGAISISISASAYDTLPNPLQLNGSVTDTASPTTTDTWTQISGPGVITFADPTNPVTTATFSQIGTYVLQLFATDGLNSGWGQITVTVIAPSVASQAQGWIGSPLYGSAVSGLVPITLAPGVTIASGTLTYTPANNANSVTVINPNVSGSGQIGVLDTTALANGPYVVQMQATDTNGDSEYSLILINVTGNFKPGRVTTTVTDLVVPAAGLPIQIQRTYDSLNASQSLDFGYGWSLGINVDLVVDTSGNVTFTLNGQRQTFYLTPQAPPCTIIGCLFPYYYVAFTPQPGLHGSLTDSSQGCPLDIVVPYGSLWECYGGSGQYDPPGYVYTDPTGTSYTISASGALQSIVDRSGNGLTITPNGITSTTGLNVPFVRDSQNRITQITDPQGNIYLYNYDDNGNLASVTYPQTQGSQTCSGAIAPNTSQYSYYPNAEYPDAPAHFYAGGTDGRCNPMPSTNYFGSGEVDAEGNSLAGKLESVTDGLGETTSYSYNLSTNTTTVTYPPDGNGNIGTAVMVYDSQGDLLSSTDPLGHTTTNTYDANLNLISTTDPLGHTTSNTYDSNGNKTSITYPATATSTNTTGYANYNQYSEPTSATDELGNVRTFNYDANYNPTSVTDSIGTLMSTTFNPNQTLQSGAIGFDITQNPGNASQFTYDANGDLTSKTDALGRTTSYTYNALGQKITMTEPIPSGSNATAATTTYAYDPFGNLTQTQAPLGRSTSSTYDSNSNKLSDTDARGNVTQYQCDALNRLVLTTYPDGTTASKTYDFRNNVIKEADQDGHVTLHRYDLAGRQISVTQAYGTANATTTSYAYDDASRMISQTDALGHSTTYTYDAAGNLLATTGVKGNFTYAYDNARDQISKTDGNGNTTQYAYDARKRLTVTTYPDQTTKSDAYDGPGNLISVTDQAGNQVQYTYDAANQLINVVQVNSPNTNANTTVYGYDADGNPITFEDANTHITFDVYDLLSELTTKTLPDGTHTETRTYDNNGNLATITHFNGVSTTYAYDQLNRLLSRATPGEATVSFTYTSTGKRQTMTDASGTTTYAYDSMDRLSSKATPEGTLSYSYDAAGNLASMNSSNTHGVSATYGYDNLNRLTSVVDGNLSGSNTTSYTYDNASNVGTVTYPNGIESRFTYDLLNRVSTMNSQISGYQYQRGATGNLTNAVELGGRIVNWTYDGIYRLTNESIASAPSGDDGAVSYRLDPVGSRLSDSSSISGISSGSWGYNADDEVSSETYDANGNVLSTGGKSFTYDSENHLMSMTASGTSATIVCDGDGNRVSKTVNGATTYYLVDDLNPTGYAQVVEELSAAGTVERQYTYGLQRINENQVLNGSWTPSFYGYDGGGNVRQLTGSGGTVTDIYEYDAFGNKFTVTGTTPNNYLYRGEQYDPDLGLYYLRARYYNPITGRFMSRDPLDAQPRIPDGAPIDPRRLHKYLYAGADPVNLEDPRGEGFLQGLRRGAIEYILILGLISEPAEEALPHIEVPVELIFKVAEEDLEIYSKGLPSPPWWTGPGPF